MWVPDRCLYFVDSRSLSLLCGFQIAVFTLWVPDRCLYFVGSRSLSLLCGFQIAVFTLWVPDRCLFICYQFYCTSFPILRGLQSKKNASTMAFQKGAKIIAGAGGSGYTLAVSALL